MCLAEPGRVASIENGLARVVTVGGPVDVSIALLRSQHEPIEVGDWVLVSLGLVLQVISDSDASALVDEHRRLHEAASDAR